MAYTSLKTTFIKFVIASLILVGGVFYSADSYAQDGPSVSGTLSKASKVNTVSMRAQNGYRYIEAYGVPHHGVSGSSGIAPQIYSFRVTMKPQSAQRVTDVPANMFFGVALDGVPFLRVSEGYWNNNPAWPLASAKTDQYGGVVQSKGRYVYAKLPTALIKKDLSHVGYAADGFPIFVSKNDKFKPSYMLKESKPRPNSPEGPGGVHDGRYFPDYEYVAGSGHLDQCNGVTVNKKYYIYILSKDFPYLPLCWRGAPDSSFRYLKIADAQRAARGAVRSRQKDNGDYEGLSRYERSYMKRYGRMPPPR